MSTSMFCFPIKVFFSCIWQRRAKTDLNSITRLLNVASVCLKGRGDLGLHIDQLDDCGYDINPFAYFFLLSLSAYLVIPTRVLPSPLLSNHNRWKWLILNQQDPELYQNVIAYRDRPTTSKSSTECRNPTSRSDTVLFHTYVGLCPAASPQVGSRPLYKCLGKPIP